MRLRRQQLERRDRRGQQRLQRLRLLLANHGVRGQRHRGDDRHQQQQQRELVKQERLNQRVAGQAGQLGDHAGRPRRFLRKLARLFERLADHHRHADDDQEGGEQRSEHHQDRRHDRAGIAQQLARRPFAPARTRDTTRTSPARARHRSLSDELEIHVFERSLIRRDAHDARAIGDQLRDDRGNFGRRPSIANVQPLSRSFELDHDAAAAARGCEAPQACRRRAAPS